MFEKMDKKLITAYYTIKFFIWFFAILCLIAAIVIIIAGIPQTYYMGIERDKYTTPSFWYYGLIPLVWSVFGTWLSIIITDVMFGFLCDVKLIRNKVYANKNDILEPIVKTDLYEPSYSTSNISVAEKQRRKELNMLLNQGLITQEEYNKALENNKQ